MVSCPCCCYYTFILPAEFEGVWSWYGKTDLAACWYPAPDCCRAPHVWFSMDLRRSAF
ncbi:MAG: hypothetical protein Q7I96_07255 [Methanobacteriaceae archaeon]|nr:hypothetical protein [Methanobacteriaceae archaeon]